MPLRAADNNLGPMPIVTLFGIRPNICKINRHRFIFTLRQPQPHLIVGFMIRMVPSIWKVFSSIDYSFSAAASSSPTGPTISSIKRLKETMPAVPPYSSTMMLMR